MSRRVDLQISRWESLIAQICIVGESKREFTMVEIVRGSWAVIEPLEELPPGKEALVEALHHFRVRGFQMVCWVVVVVVVVAVDE